MNWLENLSGWTVAGWGLSWFAFSGVLALLLGRVIGRTNEADEPFPAAVPELQAAERAVGAPVATASPVGDTWLSAADEGEFDEEYAGRASSGTRFKAVELESEVERPALRRVR